MKIIFVYNAESGIANSILDIGHKILKPDTYSCNLCQLTFGTFTENSEWKKFRKSSNHEMEFLHKDEFEKKYNEALNYPTVLQITKDGKLTELIKSERLDEINSVQELINIIEVDLE